VGKIKNAKSNSAEVREAMKEGLLSLQKTLIILLHLLSNVLEMESSSFAESDANESSWYNILLKKNFSPGSIDKYLLEKARVTWTRRVECSRESYGRTTQANNWLSGLVINENMLLTGLAALISAALSESLLGPRGEVLFKEFETRIYLSPLGSSTSSGYDKALILTSFSCAGGWPPCVVAGRLVDVIPRALFLTGDPKGLEQSVFPCVATVLQVGTGHMNGTLLSTSRPGVWLGGCAGAFWLRGETVSESSSLPWMLPRVSDAVIPSTEMVSVGPVNRRWFMVCLVVI